MFTYQAPITTQRKTGRSWPIKKFLYVLFGLAPLSTLNHNRDFDSLRFDNLPH